MSVELHLPDLPEVPLSLGPVPNARAPQRVPLAVRVYEALQAYLPLLLMLLLALATLWLVKVTPLPAGPQAPREARTEPDYEMQQFAIERFDASGRLTLRIEGARLWHDPVHDRIQIERAQIRAIAADGRVTLATAARAVGNGDGSEIQLQGGAEVHSTDAAGQPIHLRSEFLHAFLVTERVRTHLPVVARFGTTELSAGGLEYDHGARRLDFTGPMKAVLAPRAPR
jgi:lipopolysaccharide export system protein LptC